jgi:hypothetical protein
MVGDAGWGSSLDLLPSCFWMLPTKIAKQLARRVGGAMTDMASSGLTKTSRSEKQKRRHCRARKQARLGNSNIVEGFPFLYLNGNATVIPTD